MILTNQDHPFYTNQSCAIWIPHFIKMDQSGNRAKTFSIKGGFPFVLVEGTFGLQWSLAFPQIAYR